MTTFAKKLGIAMLTAVTVLAPLATAAQAGDRSWRSSKSYSDPTRLYNYREYSDRRQQYQQRYIYRQRHNNYIYRNNRDDAIALGIIGLGVGAIIGGAIANSHTSPRVIYQQPSAPYAVSGGSYEPWSQSWMRYCSNKYRSFNASTGTYRGYDGRDHFCVVR